MSTPISAITTSAVHLGVHPLDGGGELIDVPEVERQHQGVVLIEASFQHQAQLSDLWSHPGQGHVGHHRRVTLPGDEGVEHPAGRLAHHIGDHRVELDPHEPVAALASC
jgi:hypothetical protein